MKYVLFVVFLFSSFVGYNQNCNCPQKTEYTSKIEKYQNAQQNEKALSLARIFSLHKNPNCAILGYKDIVSIKLEKGELDSIEYFLQKETECIDKSSCKAINQIYYYDGLGIFYYKKAKYNESINACFKTLDILEKTNEKEKIPNINTKIATIFFLMHQLEKSLFYAQKASRELSTPSVNIKNNEVLLKLSVLYLHYSQAFKEPKYMDTSEVITHKVYDYAKKEKNQNLIINCLSNYQAYNFYKGDYQKVFYYIDSAIHCCNRNKDIRMLYSLYHDLSDTYLSKQEYKKAEQYADSAIYFAEKTKTLDFIKNAYYTAYLIAKSNKNYYKALLFYERTTFITDSIFNINQVERVNDLEQKYNKAENEKSILELNQKVEISKLNNRFLIAAVIGSIVMMLLLLFIYKHRINKEKTKTLETKQRLNRARMNPHFFFNALTSIQTLSLDEHKTTLVHSYLSKFARIMRQSLESTYNEFIILEEEQLFIEQYIEIQKLQFPNKFDYSIVIEDNLDIKTTLIPPMLLQPFIENAIEHGFKHIDYKGLLSVHFKKTATTLQVILTDNGTTNTNTVQNKNYPSRAIQIITDRLFLLNKQHKALAKFEIQTNNPGYKISIDLPILHT